MKECGETGQDSENPILYFFQESPGIKHSLFMFLVRVEHDCFVIVLLISLDQF